LIFPWEQHAHTQYRRKVTYGWVQRLKQRIGQIKKLTPKEPYKDRILYQIP